MPSPLLDSASNGTAALLDEWQLPSIDILGDNVELVAAIAVRPPRTIVPPAGWDEIRTDDVGLASQLTRYGLYRKNVPTEAGPYEDTFECTGGTAAWTAMQLAFRSLPATQPDNDDATHTLFDCLAGGGTAPPITVDLLSTPDAGNVVIAMGGTDGCGGPYTGDETWDWSAGWTPLAEVTIPVVAAFAFAYRVVAGTPEDEEATSTYNLNHRSMGYTAIFELAVDPAPAAVPVAWDVFQITAPGDAIAYVATLDDAVQKAIRPVRNEPGSGSFSLNRNGPNATAEILAPGNLVKVRIPAIDSDYIYGFFMEQGDFTLVSPDEEGGEIFTFGGRGGLSYWERAIWLSEKFVIPWWDVAWGTPPAGARGHVTFAAGKYRRYNIVGGVIDGADVDGDGFDWFTTAGFEAYFDSRQTYLWPDENSKRFLVHIMTGETHAGWYVHPHQDGVTETLPSQTVGTSTSVLLSDVSPDTPGVILYHLFLEGTDPGRPTQPIPLMTVDFDATTDSNGDPWATTDALAGLTAELGETYLDTIAKLLSTGVIDVEMGPDLDMHAYNAQGRDLSGTTFGAGKVRFVKDVNIADDLRRERDDNPVATFIEVVGTDNVIGRATLPDAASRVARETSGTGDSAEEAVLEAIGLASLNARLVKSDAIGFRIATGDDDAAGLYLPGPEGTNHGDFWLGDVVTLHTGTGDQDFDQEDERVFAVTIAEDEAGNLDVTPEVGSVLGEAERRLFANQSSRVTSFTARSQFNDTEVAEPPDLDQFELNTSGGEPVAVDHGSMGSTETIDAADGNHHRGVLNDDVTITVSPFPDGIIVLRTTQDVTGGHAIVWSGVTFAGDDQPAQDPDTDTFFVLLSDDGTVYGFPAGGSSPSLVVDDGTTTVDPVAALTVVGTGATTATLVDDGGGAATLTIDSTDTTGASATDTSLWRPLMDGAGAVITDGATGEAIMAFGPA